VISRRPSGVQQVLKGVRLTLDLHVVAVISARQKVPGEEQLPLQLCVVAKLKKMSDWRGF